MKKIATVCLGLIVSIGMMAQTATIKGKVLDKETGEPISFANVVIEDGETILGGVAADANGNYVIKALKPGKVTVKSSAVGFRSKTTENVNLKADAIRFMDIKLLPKDRMDEVKIIRYEVPIIDKDDKNKGEMIIDYSGGGLFQKARREKGQAYKGNAISGIRTVGLDGKLGLKGKVLDHVSGASISYASIELKIKDKTVAGIAADASGRYVFKGLNPGEYTIKVQAPGYKAKTFKKYTLNTSGLTQLNIQLSKK